MRDYFNFEDRVAIITGCSSGLGVQMAKALASKGCSIVAIARREELVKKVAQEIADEFGVKTLAIKCDITDTENIKEVVLKTMDTFGRIDILINNAGTGAIAPAEMVEDEVFDWEMQVDLAGAFKVAREVARDAMLPAGYGRIINIASMYGIVGNKVAGSSPYHAAKGGLINLTRALAAEWATKGITVNCICPGYFYTELTKETLDTEDFKQYAQTVIPVERYGVEGELDTATLFLASDKSTYVTGVTLPVDGGYTCV
ncbi:MAG: SDR family oxidoreductase [Eubacterium sp.]|nr:SDR family oxidoreductase [Eubacterium sp.]